MEFSQITQLKATSGASDRTGMAGRSADASGSQASPFSDAMARARTPTATSADEKKESAVSSDVRRDTQARSSSERRDLENARDKAVANDAPASKELAGDARTPGLAQASRVHSSPFPALAPTPEPGQEVDEEPLSSMDANSGDPDAMLALLSAIPGLRPLATGDAATPASGAAQGLLAGASVELAGRGMSGEARRERLPATLDGDLVAQSADTTDDRRLRLEPLSLTGGALTGNTLTGSALTDSTLTNSALTNSALAAAQQAATGGKSAPGSAFAMLQNSAMSADNAGSDSNRPGSFASSVDGTGTSMLNPLTTGNGAPGLTPTSTAPAGASIPVAVNSPQWPGALGQQVLQLHQRGEHQMQLHLNPRDLGPLSVTLTVNDQQAQLHALSAHAGVRAAVEAAFPQLREALAASGIALGEATVGDQGQPQEQSERRDGAPRLATQDASGLALGAEESLIDAPLKPVSVDSAGNINLYA